MRRHVFLRFLPLLWPRANPGLRLRVVLAVGFLITAKLCALSLPLLLGAAVDLTANEIPPTLAAVGGLVAAYALARLSQSAFAELQSISFVRVAQRAIRELGGGVFAHLHKMPLAFHLDRQTGGMSRIIDRGAKSIEFFLSFMLFSIAPTLLEIGAVCAVFAGLYGGQFAVVPAIGVLIYFAFTTVLTEWRVPYRRRINETDERAGAIAVDSLLNHETVKLFAAEEFESRRYNQALRDYEDASVKSRVTLGWLNFGQALIIAGALFSAMFLAARGAASGALSAGDFAAINAYLLQLFLPLGFLGEIYRQLRQMITDMEKMFALLDRAPQVADAPGAPPLGKGGGAVRFAKVALSLGGRAILRDLSFAAPAGARYAIVGRTGAGKTTIVRLLTRMLDPDGGEIFIDGCNVAEVTQQSLRAAVAVVSQDAAMFHDTLRYNINYGNRDAGEDEVRRAADAAMLGDFIAKLPEGLDAVVGERGLKLSGGERQRVAIARALLKSPRLLIFDEATSSLDSATEERIRAAIETASRGRTALIIAHRLATVTDADKIMVLDNGQIAESGTHRELLARGGFYAEMWRLQAEEAGARGGGKPA